ncbi:hypothetical protein FA048_09380 [Pedobacter polaris]|uniref:Uncharacterized protein n=1 Tax=Pedobacter polaris TaxID=2571273 RepID=A0A4U1CQT8_9SPHI|nr:hypothetical protein [Pedobacter polaris]TKC10391.1 hypothetical protein FA048_09380 [Pedobacter polaris]
MKKLIVIAMLGIASLFYNTATAQISLNVNIGSQPLWGPTGYDHVDYYYLPDVDSYYNVPKQQFVYLNNGNWVFNNSLPTRYSNYNLYNGYKVVINGDRPYLNYNTHKVKYSKFKNWGGKQSVIKNSNNKKYYVVKGHPHGMPPGQAKKIYNGNGKAKVNVVNVKGNNGKGNNGNGKGKGKN